MRVHQILGNAAGRAFTLIELLVVIAIIGILAGLVLYMAGGASEKNQRGAAEALIQQVDLAIREYKATMGYYPPENANDRPDRPPLYYELKGTKSIDQQDTRQMLDGDHQIRAGDVDATFGLAGFLNSQDTGETQEARNFIPNLKPANVGTQDGSEDGVRFIVFPRPGPNGPFNPVHYDASSAERHNLDGFDIWIELNIGGRTVTVGNW